MPAVSIYTRVSLSDGKRQYVLADKTSKGPFFLRYKKDGKRIWEAIRTHRWSFAKADAREREAVLLRLEGLEQSQPAKPSTPTRKTLEELRTAFIAKKGQRNKRGDLLDAETVTSYENTTREFLDTAKVKYPEVLTADHVQQWIQVLYGRKLGHRTVCNYYTSLGTFLKFCGIDHKELVDKEDRPTYTDPDPEAYTEEMLMQFFAAITNRREALYFEHLLKTGTRELEAAFATWDDIKVTGDAITLLVRNKPELGFKTKTRKNREIPLEKGLYLKLVSWKSERPNTRFIFGTDTDQVNYHFLRTCKEAATRAGLDPTDFRLHRFRDTFATMALRSGADIRTVQGWLGHSSISMTQKYLEKGKGQYAQTKMNAVFSGFQLERT